MEIFKDNLINWIILVILLTWGWMKVTPALFAQRRKRIESQLEDAQRAKQEGSAFLSLQKERIANAEKEAQNILVDARAAAASMKAQIQDEAKRDAIALEQKIEAQIAAHRQTVITELRSQAAVAALRLSEIELPAALSDNVKAGLQERFVKQLSQMGSAK